MGTTVSMTIVFAILAWVAVLNIAYAGCIGAQVGEGCVGIPVPHESPYQYDDHDRDRRSEHQHRDHGQEPHNDDDED
jgi:hypothetical protein